MTELEIQRCLAGGTGVFLLVAIFTANRNPKVAGWCVVLAVVCLFGFGITGW